MEIQRIMELEKNDDDKVDRNERRNESKLEDKGREEKRFDQEKDEKYFDKVIDIEREIMGNLEDYKKNKDNREKVQKEKFGVEGEREYGEKYKLEEDELDEEMEEELDIEIGQEEEEK